MEQTILFNKISKISLYLLVFLMPLWFLPITQDILNFQKQTLLLILTLVALVAWLAKMVSQRELNIRINWLHFPVLFLLASYFASAQFSIWRYGSFWGWPFNVSDSFLTIFFLAILYFLISSSIKDDKELINLFLAFIASAAVAGLYAILQLYGVFIIPFSFAKTSAFNTIGSVNSLAILLSVLLPLVLTLSFISKNWLKWLFRGLSVLFLLFLMLINFLSAWLVLAIGLFALLIFSVLGMKNKTESSEFSLPMSFLVIALFFLTFRISIPYFPSVPIEVFPSKTAEINILFNVLKENSALGTGPGTFVYDYAKYHLPSINQTIFWSTKFSAGASEFLDWFAAKGIIGGAALVWLIAMAIFLSVKTLTKPKVSSISWPIGVGVLSSFAAMTAAHIFYFSNFTLSFLFWLLLAAIGVLISKTEKKILVSPSSISAIVCSFVFLLILIFGFGLLFIGGQKYAAEIQYFKGVKLANQGDVQGAIFKVLSAARLNSSLDLYWRDLSQLYLSQLNQILANENLSEEEKRNQSQVALSNIITASNQSIGVNPVNVENWNVRGFVFRSLIGFEGADAAAIDSYNRAIQLEPSSPFDATELGRVHLIRAEALANQKDSEKIREEALNEALQALNHAITLKPDYSPAHYLIALVYVNQGKSGEAISKLEETTRIAPNDIGLAFQLGVMYYQNNQFDKAQAQFERTKNLNPDYSNARYMLGLVYDRQGRANRAINEFKKVLSLNPDNEQVKKILDNLNNGKSALTDIQLERPPVQDNPSEIKPEVKPEVKQETKP